MTSEAASSYEGLTVKFDVTVVEGEAGRRLARVQARAVLDVLVWFHENRKPLTVEAAITGDPAPHWHPDQP